MKCAFVKIIFASGDDSAELAARTSFYSKNLFIFFSRWHFILKSIFKEKFTFPRSVKCFSEVLSIDVFVF